MLKFQRISLKSKRRFRGESTGIVTAVGWCLGWSIKDVARRISQIC